MKKLFTGIIFLVILVTCTEEEITSRAYPRVRTMAVANITAAGALFRGEIAYSEAEVVDHGFVWSTVRNPSIGTSEKISLGQLNETGLFTATIERSLAQEKKYYVRAYAKSKSHLVYGDEISFISLGSKAPVLSDITPKKGTWGDAITLVGSNFSDIESENVVKFSDEIAHVIESKKDTLLAIVPATLQKDKSDVSVSFDGNISVLLSSFELLAPSINEIVPSEGPVGTLIEIKGEKFNPIINKVFFGAKEATVISSNAKSITCKVLEGLPNGINVVKIQSGEGKLFATGAFDVQNPIIYKIEPSIAFIGDTISIIGDYFLQEIQSNIVRFDDDPVSIVSSSKTRIDVIVPYSIYNSKPKISIESNINKIETSSLFSLHHSEIISVEPLRISTESQITIKGKYFNPYTQSIVRLEDTPLDLISISENEIIVKVTSYALSHELNLKVTWADQIAVYDQQLTSPWKMLPNIAPAPFSSPAIFSYDEKIFAGLDNYYQDNFAIIWPIWMYNSADDSWTEFARFPEQVSIRPFVFVSDSKAYFGHVDDVTVDITYKLWSLDLLTKEWVELSDTPFSPDDTPFSFSISNTGYVIKNVGANESQLWEYNASQDQWNLLSGLMFNANSENVKFVINDKLYLIEGTTLRRFDPINNLWAELGQVPIDPIFGFAIDGFGYVGSAGNGFVSYNPINDTWREELNYMGVGRLSGYSCSINGRAYLFGGHNWYGAERFCYEFNPKY